MISSYVKLTGEANGDAGDKYTGLDRFGRVVDQRWWRVGGGSNVDRYQYTYDRNSNRTARTNVVNTNLSETYGYDNLNQLTSFAVTGTTKSWDYDAVGNWDGVTTNSATESRTHNLQNELLTATSQTSPTYDDNGNQTTDFAGRTFVYDAWNRTKQVNPSGGGSALRTYELDGLGRRIEETTGSNTTDFYYSDSWQLLEERVNDTAFATYVWSGSGYVDEMIVRYRDADGNSGNGLEERLWVLQDANYNVTGLVTNSGTVLERYSYDPYGTATVYDASWTVRTGGSNYGWNYGHQGLRFDGTTGKHHARYRDYDAAQGRWSSIDPMGFGAGDRNLYRSQSNGPTVGLDPLGLWKVQRSGGKTAVAVSDDGDTIKKLADEIGLSSGELEWPHWVTIPKVQVWTHLISKSIKSKTGDEFHSTLDDMWGAKTPLCANQKIEIPNTVLALWVGDLGDAGKKAVSWNSDISYLKERGFFVDERDASLGGSGFTDYMYNNTKNGTLHGLFVTGHGGRDFFSQKGGASDPTNKFYVEYNNFVPKMQYKLGLGIMNVCFGGFCQNDDVKERFRGKFGWGLGGRDIVSNSRAAKFYGLKRTLVPGPFLDTAHPSDLLKPGEQLTKP